ncbi:MAG: phosphatase PAP2 family protein [Candidatus Kapaibacterium sp.]
MFHKAVRPLIRFRIREVLKMTDVYTLAMLGFYTLLAILFYPLVESAMELIYLNISIAIGVISIATVEEKMNAGRIFTIFRRIYIIPVIYLIYSQVQYYIPVINPHNYDKLLMDLDIALFGLNPTEWLHQFAHPILTEYLQFTYMLFFFMPLVHALELHYEGDNKRFGEFTRIIMFAFYFSYLLYFFMPAIGPRFTIHNFFNINSELPGLLLTNLFRDFVNMGGNVLPGESNPMDTVNRDCMPSGHTMITFITIIMVFRHDSRFKWPILVFGISLIFSTVYLWYHYVIDIIAGIVFAIVALYLEPVIRNYVKSKGYINA